jgi:2,3-bisphosphoglycerate-independent phosphoglycerate mutase
MKARVVLLVLDGWGIGRNDYTNPIFIAKPKTIQQIKSTYRMGSLQSSGIAVGLPWEEEGNSEVGHLTIGAGKTIYQHFPRITLSIENGEFFKNKALTDAFAHAKKNSGSVHLAGLLTEGNVHSSLEHVKALMLAAQTAGVDVRLHFFSDGKDSAPQSLEKLLDRTRGFIKEFGVGTITSIAGRFYALDRDGHWDRIEKTYRALTGKAPVIEDVHSKITDYYMRGLDDEFIEPMVVGPAPRPIRDGDAVIFYDFREDSIRQIASSFILKDFDKFPTEKFKNLYIATMTEYSEKFDVPVISPSERVEEPLGKVIADAGLLQLRLAETEKYAHVTYFLNGYREKPFPNEYRVLIPSQNVAGYDLAPEMMTKEISNRLVTAIEERGFDFIAANFASPDVIAHTGNFDAAIQAIMIVDEEIKRIMDACLANDTVLVITSDHGNIEEMIDPFTGRVETRHDPSPVPFYIVGKQFIRQKAPSEVQMLEHEAVGVLADVAPTILDILSLPKPPAMTGQSLLKILR